MKTIKHKAITLTSSILLLACAHVNGQNLVNDPGFTLEKNKCPDGYGQIIKTESWTNANGGTVDLFDPRASKYENGVPQNYMGEQSPREFQNYAGIIAYYDDGDNTLYDKYEIVPHHKSDTTDGYKRYTEYLQGEFNEPMVAGKAYNVSFMVSLADKSGRAVSNLGAYISTAKNNYEKNTFLPFTPQILTHRVIKDTAGWVKISGVYIAQGGEKYITIGCFMDERFRVQKVVGPMENDLRKAYYYLADVNVSPYIGVPDMDAIVWGIEYVELTNLRFALNSADIEAQYYPELESVATWMISHPEYKFFIAGYTDKTGNDAINDPLSVDRARAVKTFLVNRGVRDENIVVEGFGSENPIEDKIKSRLNRRVEIYMFDITPLESEND